MLAQRFVGRRIANVAVSSSRLELGLSRVGVSSHRRYQSVVAGAADSQDTGSVVEEPVTKNIDKVPKKSSNGKHFANGKNGNRQGQNLYQKIDRALISGNTNEALRIFKDEYNPGIFKSLERRGLHLRLFRAALKLKSKKGSKAVMEPKELFQKYLEGGAAVGWITSAVILTDVREGNPALGLQTWVEYLENLNTIGLVTSEGNKEAAWSALVAYVANCVKEKQPISTELALKLVPIKDIPLGRQLMDIEEFRRLNHTSRKEILEGLQQIRMDSLDVSSLEFLTSLPSDRPLELEAMYKEALAKVGDNGLPESVYARFISCFAESTRVKDAFEVWNHMIEHEVEPTILSWNSLLRAGALSRVDKTEVFTKLWGEMVESGVKPNSESFRSLIDFCFRTGKPEQALQVLDRIQEGKEEGVTVTLTMFNTVLDGLLRLGKVTEAEGLLREGLTQGYSPNVVTYNYFIRSYIQLGQFEKANAIVQEMIAANVRPDISTYTNIIDSVFKQARKQGFDPQQQIYDLFVEMGREGIKTNAISITAIISGLTKTSNDIESARTLFRIMLEKKITPNARTFGTLIDSELKFGDYQHALDYFNMMPKFGVPQGTPAFNQLIHWASYNKRVTEAHRLFKQLVKSTRTNPNKFTYTFILNGCYKNDGGSQTVESIAIANDVLKTLSKQEGYFDFGTDLPKLIPKLAALGATVPESVVQALEKKTTRVE
ncbi:Pentatricopeptide repeat-containing protein [Sugiyamaella lignohabitans]|uniref:Pentatricopeptide repeat-containing protein n=1 Tax=Sugiyamaella lignohabitans TaxID=796027 RepID=A0A161HH26_9ASCO|nr:Pentatricopeptide repeat-containing protein [Sugiyamaella lignohabitans]ANB11267.1 Pentatricopeptide repeat-containing protein [Sugiyamaella lignohabitans]